MKNILIIFVSLFLIYGCDSQSYSDNKNTPSTTVITDITVMPLSISLIKRQTQQLVATATHNDGTSSDITSTVKWIPVDSTIVIVTPDGILSCVEVGSTNITAQKDGITSNKVSINCYNTEKKTEILLTSQSGGSGTVGLWSVLNGDFSLNGTFFETKGLPSSNISDLFSESGIANMGGKKTGFVYSNTNKSFYGIIDNAVIKFDPVLNEVHIVTIIPKFYKSTYHKLFSNYVLKPVISNNGKSLIVIATRGGIALPASPAGDSTSTSGGLVHINVDESSSNYGKANIVFEFFDYSNAVGKNWRDRILEIVTEPMLYDDGTGYSIFLGSEYVSIDKDMCSQKDHKCTTYGKLFSMHPSDQSDWSKPWLVRGSLMSHLVTLGRTPFYDSRDNAIWVVGENNDQMLLFKITPEGKWAPDPASFDGIWSQSHIVRSITHGTYHPQAVVAGNNNNAQVWTTGNILSNIPEFRYPRLTDIHAHKAPELLQIFQGLWKPDLSRYAQPTHITASRNSSIMWVVSNSDVTPHVFESKITDLKQNHTYGSDEYSKNLQTLLAEYNVVASYVDEIGTSSLYQHRLFSSDATNGTFFAGSVAAGDEGSLNSSLYTNGLLLTLATGGGENGDGAIIKYNRNTAEITSIPLGTYEAGYPVGKAYQLNSSIVIGGTSKVAKAKLKPMETSVGIWTANLQTGEVSNERLPGSNVKGVAGDVYLEAVSPPLSFVKASTGDLWANATYWAYDSLSFIVNPETHDEFRAGLIKVDSSTGTIKAGPFITTDGPKFTSEITPLSGNGEFAMFFEGAGVNDTPSIGQNLIIYSLNNMDPSNYKKLAFSPEKKGLSSGLWGTFYSPVYDSISKAWYAITTKNISTNEINIVKLSAVTNIMTDPVITNLNVSWPTGHPINKTNYIRTSLFVGSDHSIYFGTSDGKLMRFIPSTSSVELAYDFAPITGSAEVRGFLNENEGAIIGLVIDSTNEIRNSGVRAFSYDLKSGIANTVNIDNIASSDDIYPGLNLINR